ncbi:MAG: ThuA domain-containing protein [Gammaproteobacteria bacterium]
MNPCRYLLFVLVAGLLAGCNGETANTGDINILVFSKTDGYRHQSIPSAIRALRQLADDHNVAIDTTEDATSFSLDSLSKYDAVVFLLTTGDVLDDDQQHAFTRFIRAGGGFVGIHSASDTEHDWPWYGELVGGFFNGHPFNPNVREGTVLVADASHPSTRMLPATWVRTDEWYDFHNFRDGITILLNVDEASYKRSEENPAPEPRPIAWFHEFDGGRSFYTALGHTEASYSDSLFLAHIWGGLGAVLGEKGEYLSTGTTQLSK